jgi:thiamine-monophosphate kinase
MTEFDLIALLTRDLPASPAVRVGPGDDCAVLDLGIPGQDILFKTDSVVEGVHFTTETPPEFVGRKALARNLSDIAAMGGRPGPALVTVALPRDFQADYVQRVYAGLRELADRFGVAIAGGETTTNPERMWISIALMGTVETGRAVLRSGAKPGDAIFVTGELGGSLQDRHLTFEPRLPEGEWLRRHFELHAMIDLSDGLAGDIRHILKQSRVGAEVLVSAIPISRAAKLAARNGSAKTPLAAALTDGEDFELLFTVASGCAVSLLDQWKAVFPEVRLSCIGKVTAEPGLRLRDTTGIREFSDNGYTHFA